MSYCSAIRCYNCKTKEDCHSKTFFHFPHKDPALLKIWLNKLNREYFEPTISDVVCSDHFDEKCFKYGKFTNKRTLICGSFPTKFIFSELKSSNTDFERCLPSTSAETIVDIGDISTDSMKKSVGIQTDLSEVDELVCLQKDIIDKKKLLEERKFIPENIKDDSKMISLTGFTRERFFSIYTFLNVEEDLQRNAAIRPIDLFFLFLVKLKTGAAFDFLSVLFDTSDSPIACHFDFVTNILYQKLQLLNIFPSKAQVMRYMPVWFHRYNKDCRIIVDFIEFPVEEPGDPEKYEATLSDFKDTNTVKGMIGFMPSGTITLISPLYYGNISDEELFAKSKLLNLLEPEDVVMAHDEILIEGELEKIGCKLKYLTFFEDKIQFGTYHMGRHLEVTYERVASKISQYKYFDRVFPYESLPHIDRVYFIACLLLNFHNHQSNF